MNDIQLLREFISEAIVTGRKLDKYASAIKRHVLDALKDSAIRKHLKDTGEAHFKLQDVSEIEELDYLRDVIVKINTGNTISADAAYEFDLDRAPEKRVNSDLLINLILPAEYPDQIFNKVSSELIDAIRHELEHSGQESWELMDCHEKTPSADQIWSSIQNAAEYYLCPAEVKAHVAGFMKRAKFDKRRLSDVIDHELYQIYQTGKTNGYSEKQLHKLMKELQDQYHMYAKQRYPRSVKSSTPKRT